MSKTRARENQPTREKETLSPRRVSSFLAWGDFHARSRFARSTIPEEKWGTTRSLEQPDQLSTRVTLQSYLLYKLGEIGLNRQK